MVLADHGPGIENVELAMQEGYSTAPDKVRALGFGAGMGLPNIKKYTDEMKIDTEKDVGTTISLKVYTCLLYTSQKYDSPERADGDIYLLPAESGHSHGGGDDDNLILRLVQGQEHRTAVS